MRFAYISLVVFVKFSSIHFFCYVHKNMDLYKDSQFNYYIKNSSSLESLIISPSDYYGPISHTDVVLRT